MTELDPSGASYELDFWRTFVQTPRFLDGWCGNFKTPELNQQVADFILSVPHKKVLDIGSGVVSILHGLMSDIELIPVDPLAEMYQTVFDYEGKGLPVPLNVPAEDLAEHFKQKRFDIVHCSNALDHCKDPIIAYHAMMAVVKKGGYLIIQGFENEGVFEKYSGFHQWNLSIVDNRLTVANKRGVVGQVLNSVRATTIKLDTGKDWFIWIEKKA